MDDPIRRGKWLEILYAINRAITFPESPRSDPLDAELIGMRDRIAEVLEIK